MCRPGSVWTDWYKYLKRTRWQSGKRQNKKDSVDTRCRRNLTLTQTSRTAAFLIAVKELEKQPESCGLPPAALLHTLCLDLSVTLPQSITSQEFDIGNCQCRNRADPNHSSQTEPPPGCCGFCRWELTRSAAVD